MSEAKLLIKLLGVFAAQAATDSLLVDIDGCMPVHELIRRVREQVPPLVDYLPDMNDPDSQQSVMVLVNKKIASPDTLVRPGDQTTIVSPFGGG